ncbi:MAG: hypothetical protein ACRD1M_17980 [Terriglobales bacterium]
MNIAKMIGEAALIGAALTWLTSATPAMAQATAGRPHSHLAGRGKPELAVTSWLTVSFGGRA